ncbi:MAG: SEL1-like repeat protein [Victivallaceae bacterium]|nr:SEL1-like repeat protein [Victivallaceae bacterium]
MLGDYYKQGRPGVKKNIKKAVEIFSSIISDVSKSPSKMTGKDYCILGRAYMAQCNGNYGHDTSLKRKANQAFKFAQEKAYLPAWYYPEYYRKNSGKFKLDKLLKALPSHDPQVEAFVAGLAQFSNQKQLRKYRDNVKNLASIKVGIKSHDVVSQFMLGLLYMQKGIKSEEGYPLTKNLPKARFWLERAAQRGSREAAQILKQSKFKTQKLRESKDGKYFRAGKKSLKLTAIMLNENARYKKFNCRKLTLTSRKNQSPIWQKVYFDSQRPDAKMEKLLFYAISEDKKKQFAYLISICNNQITNTSNFNILEIGNNKHNEIKEMSFPQGKVLSDAFLYTANTDEKLYLALVSTDFDGKVKYYSFDKKTKQLILMPTKASGVKYKAFK